MSEQVLVVPRAFLFGENDEAFQGLLYPIDSLILDMISAGSFFMPRAEMERDPRYKQLIIYMVLRHRDTVFIYRRAKGAGEKRLQDKYSLGLGGHINPCRTGSFRELLSINLRRELLEEIQFKGIFSYRFLGILNDDLTDVGLYHLGLVYLVTCDTPEVVIKEKDKLVGGLRPVEEITQDHYLWESWSSFLLPEVTRFFGKSKDIVQEE